MTDEDYRHIFEDLWNHSENEVVEFKRAKDNFDIDDLGRYFSALSNEANLRDREFAWLVMGVFEKKHIIEGTNFKNSDVALNKLKQDMSQHTTDNLIFRDIMHLDIEGKRVLLFQIPASPRNMVMHWKGIAYSRDGESIKPMNQAKRDEIRFQSPAPDWTAYLVDNATLSDLDDMALAKARVMFKRVHAANIPSEEVDGWSTEEFLSHSEVMREGHLTRAAILLLGKPESLCKIYPTVARITWTLEDKDEIVQDYEHFTIPFIITVDEVLSKIRNMTMRELPGGTLFPDTMKQYDSYTIRETIHNSVAHQDYQKQERINFVERPDSIYCSNGGSFLPGTIEEALNHKGPQRHYRNECLCRGMVNFNMIDTVGRGIKKMFSEQRKRFFPMPDYDIDNEHGEVGVTIYGKMIDEKYTQLLRSGKELSLKECIWLDAIQKRRPVSSNVIKYLKAHRLIEGRAPHYTISLTVARMTGQLTKYTHERGLEREKIVHMLDQFILNAGKEGVKRDAIFDYVKETLPSLLDNDHQLKQLSNYLSTMQKDGLITCVNRRWHSCRKNH